MQWGLLRTPNGPEYPNYEISALVVEKMWRIVCLKELQSFYTQQQLQTLVDRACKHDYRTLMNTWELPTIDMTVDLAVLGLYDIVLFLDDSGSMETFEPKENMSRFSILSEVVKTIGFWASLMDSDGVVVRFFNSNVEGNGVSSLAEIQSLFQTVKPSNSTPMGEELDNKIFSKVVNPYLSTGTLNRPVIVVTITDGIPNNEQRVIDTIKKCKDACLYLIKI